jgi:two-component system response regulator TctD
MRVLLLQGDVRGAVHAELMLRQMDFAVDKAASVEDAVEALAVNGYDLLVADLDTIDGSSIGQCLRAARASDAQLRLLVMAARERMDGVAAALERGADDFLIKPVDPSELRLRVHNLSARRSDKAVLECGPLKLHVNTGEVSLDGKPVEVTPRERAVLQILLRESGNAVGKDFIASRIFSMDNEATPTAIETYVSRLRRKLAHPRVQIRTVHGLGYLLARTPASVAAALALICGMAGDVAINIGRTGIEVEAVQLKSLPLPSFW